jgi:hypothetical protein
VPSLTPKEYRCGVHHDSALTNEVLKRAEEDVRVVALNFRFGRRRPVGFRVRVHCPMGPDGGHGVEFSGSYTP